MSNLFIFMIVWMNTHVTKILKERNVEGYPFTAKRNLFSHLVLSYPITIS